MVPGDASMDSQELKLDHYSAFFSCAEQIEAFATAAAVQK
jgi:hypothetical protein